jgi:hypothetical protein
MTAKFAVGQRVIVKQENLCGAIHAGYYGHIASVRESARNRQPVYGVHLDGRHGYEIEPWMLSTEEGFNPLAFFEDELEAAD